MAEFHVASFKRTRNQEWVLLWNWLGEFKWMLTVEAGSGQHRTAPFPDSALSLAAWQVEIRPGRLNWGTETAWVWNWRGEWKKLLTIESGWWTSLDEASSDEQEA